ncbi:hypothetical protein HYH03_016326 [Edaphochlamys debaryana]|uniref:CUE domain-containing protein n=1 Tax=Edaphochlamys debaryana TaxID=47281 RepID=A0A835XQ34_9CHLO|nr:hypothetical protein HYH03_016326 [Edaphochlamys debaryana]|eukprot:KAG2484940.1 hypothetical protein HYH03_016326 [Edaphochlamys debaryana]
MASQLVDMFPSLPEDVLQATLDAHDGDLEQTIITLLDMCGDDDSSALGDAAATAFAHASAVSPAERNGTSQAQLMTAAAEAPPKAASAARGSRGGKGSSGSGGSGGGRARMSWGQLRSEASIQVSARGSGREALAAAPAPVYTGEWGRTAAPAPADFPTLAAFGPSPTAFPSPPPAASPPPPPPSATQLRSPQQRSRVQAGGYGGGTGGVGGGGGGRSRGGSSQTGPSAAARPSVTGPASPLASPEYARAATRVPGGRGGMRESISWPRLSAAEEGDGGGGGWGGGWGGGGGGSQRGCSGSGAADEEGGGGAWQAEVVEQLCRSHDWAGRELVEAVCAGLGWDLGEVGGALEELRAGTFQGPGSSSSCSASSSSEEGERRGRGREGGRRHWRGQYGRYDNADEDENDAYDNADGRGADEADRALDERWAAGDRLAAEIYMVDIGPSRPKLGPRQAQGGRPGPGLAQGRRDEGEAGAAFERHRQESRRLWHERDKLARRMQAAFSHGDHAAGRALLAEVKAVKAQAEEADRGAAARIEAEVNAGRSAWELDLHGLYGPEALQALDRRLALLESGATPSPGPAAPGPGPAASTLAARRCLRVVVGKGLHSSGGEAALPRLVAAHLQARGCRFAAFPGYLEVTLRPAFALAAAGVGAGAAAGVGVGAGAVLATAAHSGSVPLLQALRARGCPWDHQAWAAAADSGSVPALEWLREGGCPVKAEEPLFRAACAGDWVALSALVRLGLPLQRCTGLLRRLVCLDPLGEAPRVPVLEWLARAGAGFAAEAVAEAAREWWTEGGRCGSGRRSRRGG